MAAVEYETSRPCPECGRDVDLSNVKPGGKTFCRSSAHPGRRISIGRRKTPAAAIAADTRPGWDDEPPAVLDWPGLLGAECPESPRCDDDCGCSRPPIRYSADHAGTICPECGPGCWDVPPGAVDRGQAHVRESAPAGRVASTAAAQSDLDRAAREFERQRAALLDGIERWLAVDRLSRDSASDLRWYHRAVSEAPTPARLAQLRADLDRETFTVDAPVSVRRPQLEPGELPELDDDQDQDDDQAARGNVPLCQRCYAACIQQAALMRIHDGPVAVDVCAGHAVAAGYPNVQVIIRYAPQLPAPRPLVALPASAQAQRRELRQQVSEWLAELREAAPRHASSF